jgi:hypothetical protein
MFGLAIAARGERLPSGRLHRASWAVALLSWATPHPSPRFTAALSYQSRASYVALIGSRISWVGPGVWQQHHPLAGDGWSASVGWPLAVLPRICGSGRCRLDRREDRRFPPNVHVGLSTAGVLANILRSKTRSNVEKLTLD